MTAETILYIILSLLRADNATNLDQPEVHNHLVEVSQAISAHATKAVPATRLISLAYNESRFGYREVQRETFPKSSWNACGIYQVVPKWSPLATTCEELGTDVDHATKVAVAYVEQMIDRWKIKGSAKMDTRMCHYYSGNVCDEEAHDYAKRHRKIRLKAISLSTKGKRKVKAKKRKVAPKKVRLSEAEFQHAMRNEQDERVRAKLGLPPLSL